MSLPGQAEVDLVMQIEWRSVEDEEEAAISRAKERG